MSVKWEDIVFLLHGNERTGSIVSELLCEISTLDNLPNIFHTLCCSKRDYVSSEDWITRNNSAKALHGLCRRYQSSILSDLSVMTQSDGDLLKLSDLNIDKILGSDYSNLFSGTNLSGEYLTEGLYSKSWLTRQRRQLVKRLGLMSSGSSDVVAAYKYDQIIDIIEDKDVEASESNILIPVDCAVETFEVDTCEYWFVRILRLLTVGMLDTSWETRQGYCLALSKIIAGFMSIKFYHDNSTSLSIVADDGNASTKLPSDDLHHRPSHQHLPLFLLEDILCTGICTLLLDRFVDFDAEGNEMIAPVKEMVGQLIYVALVGLHSQQTMKSQVFAMLTRLIREQDWMIRYSGTVALKYFMLLHREWVNDEKIANNSFEFISSLLKDDKSDIKIGACNILSSMAKVYATSDQGSFKLSHRVISDHVRNILLVFEGPKKGINLPTTIQFITNMICIYTQYMLSHDISSDTDGFNIVKSTVTIAIKGLQYFILDAASIDVQKLLDVMQLILKYVEVLAKVYTNLVDAMEDELYEFIMLVTISLGKCDISDDNYHQESSTILQDIPKALIKLGNSFILLQSSVKASGKHQCLLLDAASLLYPPDILFARWDKISEFKYSKNPFFKDHNETIAKILVNDVSFLACFWLVGLTSNSDPHRQAVYGHLSCIQRILFQNVKDLSSTSSATGRTAPCLVIKGLSTVEGSLSTRSSYQHNRRTQLHLLESITLTIYSIFCYDSGINLSIDAIAAIQTDLEPGPSPVYLNQIRRLILSHREKTNDTLEIIQSTITGKYDNIRVSSIYFICKLLALIVQGLISSESIQRPQTGFMDELFLLLLMDAKDNSKSVISISKMILIDIISKREIEKEFLSWIVRLRIQNGARLPIDSQYSHNYTTSLCLRAIGLIVSHLSEDGMRHLIDEKIHVRLLQSYESLSDDLDMTGHLADITAIYQHFSKKYCNDEDLWSEVYAVFFDALMSTNFYGKTCMAVILERVISTVDLTVIIDRFEDWISLILMGIGNYDTVIRKNCIQAFRYLVPLAAILKEKNRCRQIKSSNRAFNHSHKMLNDFILQRSTPPSILQSESDRSIIEYLSSHTQLNAMNQSMSLRSYQWDGISYITHLRRCGLGCLLADDMGLGKTIQALTSLAIIRIEKEFRTHPFLVICPASLVHHWEIETSNNFPSSILSSISWPKTTKDSSYHHKLSGESIVIVSYDAIRRYAENLEDSPFHRQVWEGIVLDEAHIVRNPSTKTARAIFQLRSLCRIALTGTPIQNHVEEIWSLMNFLIPDFLGDYKTFKEKYVKPIRSSMKQKSKLDTDMKECLIRPLFSHIRATITAEGLQALHELHKQVLPFILRRMKEDVLKELPPKTINDIQCPLSEIQSRMYSSFMRENHLNEEILIQRAISRTNNSDDHPIQEEISAKSLSTSSLLGTSSNKSPRIHPFKAIKYLQLLCIHPSLVISSKHRKYKQRLMSDVLSSGKMRELIRLLLDCNIISRDECSNSLSKLLQDDTEEVLDDNCPSHDHSGSSDHSDDDRDHQAVDNIDEDEHAKKRAKGSDDQEISYTLPIDNIPLQPRKDIRSDLFRSAIKIDRNAADNVDRKQPQVQPNAAASSQSTRKCLIFVQHKATLDIIADVVLKTHFPTVKYARLDGTVSPSKRSLIAEQFNARHDSRKQSCDSQTSIEDESPRILLMTTRACGLGLNLTAADTAIFVEHDWNPFADLQAMDRVHRLGQTRPVNIYRLLAESSVESRLINVQDIKKLIAKKIVHNDNELRDEDDRNMKEVEAPLGDLIWRSIVSSHNVASSSGADTAIDRGSTEGYDEYESFDIDKFLASLGKNYE